MIRTARGILAVWAAAAGVAACGVSARNDGHIQPPTSTSPGPPGRGGLLGSIDGAKLTVTCANVSEAQSSLEGGVGSPLVDPIVRAAADALSGPPVDAETTALASRLRADVSAHREADAVAALTAFCHEHGH